MSNYTNVTIGQADTSGALTDIDIQGSSPQDVNLVIASLRQPVDMEGDITDAQFAEMTGTTHMVQSHLKIFTDAEGVASFARKLNAFMAELNSDAPKQAQRSKKFDQVENYLVAITDQARLALSMNNATSLRAYIMELVEELEELGRMLNS